jgi:hypothetical protein
MVECHHIQRRADRSERVKIGMADMAPVGEFDPQLDGGIGLPQELRLVDAKPAIE